MAITRRRINSQFHQSRGFMKMAAFNSSRCPLLRWQLPLFSFFFFNLCPVSLLMDLERSWTTTIALLDCSCDSRQLFPHVVADFFRRPRTPLSLAMREKEIWGRVDRLFSQGGRNSFFKQVNQSWFVWFYFSAIDRSLTLHLIITW